MRRKLIVFAAIVASLTAPARAQASSPVVYVSNESTVIPQEDVLRALPAFQVAVSRDLATWWGVDAQLTTDPSAAHDMSVTITDDATCLGCLGYHDVIGNQPAGFVFARTSAYFHDSWQLVFTHELFEMLVDPWINRFAIWNKKTWLVEVADQVESGYYAYSIDGVVISDFILPGWFGGMKGNPVDFTHGLKKPGQIGRHGYGSWKNPDGTWGQAFG